MNGKNLSAVLVLAMLVALTTSGCNQRRDISQAERPEPQTKTVDGLTFYYGVVKGAAAAENSTMQMGQPESTASYHIVLALFDTASKRRITDASVSVRLARSSAQDTGWLPMKFMRVAGTESYGRYVEIPSPGRYRLEFQVVRQSTATPINAQFVFDRPE